MLAPVVALVPTERPSEICSNDEVMVPVTALVTNNTLSLLIGSGIAIVVAYVIARIQNKVELKRPSKATIVGIALGLALLVGGVWWYQAERANFQKYAHGTAATSMFVAIWCAVMVNAGWPRSVLLWVYQRFGEKFPVPTPRQLRYRRWYRGVSLVMAAAAFAALASLLIDFDKRIFWLEALEIAPFAVFWTLQTLEAWESGVTTKASAPSTSAPLV